MTREEEEEVRSLLSRHQERIILDLNGTDLLAVLVKNSVLTSSEEDLVSKSSTYPPATGAKRKLSTTTIVSGGNGSGIGFGGGSVGGSVAGSSTNNSRSASVNGDGGGGSNSNDNRSLTPSVISGSGGCDKEEITNNSSNLINDVDILRVKCNNLIEIIAKNGFEKFKQFCYAIENECPQLIEDLINDRLKCDSTTSLQSNEEKITKELDTIEYIEKDKENDRSRRSVSYSGSTTMTNSLPRAAPRRISLMKEPPPPPPPKPSLSSQTTSSSTTIQSSSTSSPIPSKFPQTEYNLIQKLDSSTSGSCGGGGVGDSTSTLTAVSTSSTTSHHHATHQQQHQQQQQQNLYQNHQSIIYSSLLCHARATTQSPAAVRKREKLLHRFSDAATLGRKLKKKKNTNRTCHSMTEAIEMLADPVIEDEFFGDRTTWEYHTVSVTRVPGYGFGIAVSGGRDNPHFANGDPSIAVSDVLKGGPAEDRLQVNDRIISVNGVSLENVEYATAVQVLRDSGNTVTLVVKRRVPLNASAHHQHSHSMSSVGLPPTMTNGNGNIGLPGNGGGGGGGGGNGLIGNSHSGIGLPMPGGQQQQNQMVSSIINNQATTTSSIPAGQPIKVTLTKSNKKEDFGIVLGCRLFVKEISSKARDQLAANGYALQEGDTLTRIHNTNCGDTMSLKEAKKIIDGCKERLNLVVLRDITNQAVATATSATMNQLNNSTTSNQTSLYSHTQQVSNCSNNLDDPYMGGGASYSSQNLYVQPPTRSSTNAPGSGLTDEKSNLTPRGRSRGPLLDGVSLSQLDRPVTPPNGTSGVGGGSGGGRSRSDEPPRPPPPRGSSIGGVGNTTAISSHVGANEDFYSSRRQLYEDDPLQRSRQSAEPRFISFQKEGSVGIRLTGGNEAGIFVTAVQPGSPASLQGLTPGDKILKVNDMDMHGVTREEAVLFLLSLQDRIDLIVQYCKEEYEEVVANQRGDSFHIKTHFHCENPSKGEMAFKAGDVFRVIDTLHNGVVGSWQVLKIGRGHQEMQRGVIPNKSRAEELATAQFNATKKEMNASESRGNFFRRRRSTHRRSKSLSRENWDDVVFSDSISKFPAYERVVLRHPGFVRPVVLFGPVSDISREKLTKDFPDKFTAPLQDDDKSNSKCRIVRLSNIRDIMERGKHALLDITPNAVDRLNYAQFYPIVIFLKTDNKHVIKQLRHGLPKSAHKSSKKLLDQCQKLDRVWSHIFSTQIILNDTESWYRKLREAIDLQQSGAVWMSETKLPDSPTEMIFPPYIAPPCSLPCCHLSSSSVPRYAIRGRNSFSLSPVGDRSITPPRPPPVSSYNDQQQQQRQQHFSNFHSLTPPASMPTQLSSYCAAITPCIKPASSMPGGLAQTQQPQMRSSNSSADNLHRTSQPNLMSRTSFMTPVGSAKNCSSDLLPPKRDTQSISNLTSTTPLAASTNSNLTFANGPGPTNNTERRTTPYYYNELFSSSTVFDSNLNVRYPADRQQAENGAANTNLRENFIISGGSGTSVNTSNGVARMSATAAAAAAAAAGASVLNGFNANHSKSKNNLSTTLHHHQQQRHHHNVKSNNNPSKGKYEYDVNCNIGNDGGGGGGGIGSDDVAGNLGNIGNNGHGGNGCGGGNGSAETLCEENGFGPIPAARSTLSNPVESLSDDFLFPMTTSRLSYASSPESDLELSPGPSASLSLGNLPQLVKSSSDPSIATNQDNLDRDRDIIGEGLPPPYTNPYEHPNNPPPNRRQTMDTSKYSYPSVGIGINQSIIGQSSDPISSSSSSIRPQSLYGINAPDLPPRIDRQSKPGPGELHPASRTNSSGGGTIGRSAQERLFGKAIVTDDVQAEYVTRNIIETAMEQQRTQASLDRQQQRTTSIVGSPTAVGKSAIIQSQHQQQQQQQQNGSYDSVSSYDSYNTAQLSVQNIGRLGPNAPDDLKSVPSGGNGRPLAPTGLSANAPEYARSMHDHHARNFIGANDLNRQNSPGRPQYHEMTTSSRNIDPRNAVMGAPQRPSNLGLESSPRKQILETKTDYGKYSRNNSASQADYSKIPKNPHMIVPPPNVSNGNGTPNGNGGPFKPVPPPKPKNYRPPMQSGGGGGSSGNGQWENGEPSSPRSPNGFFYPPAQSHYHHSQQTPGSPRHNPTGNGPIPQNPYSSSGVGGSGNVGGHYGVQQPPYQSTNGYNGNGHHYSSSGGGGGGIYMQHRAHPSGMGNHPQTHTPERHALDLAGSREQRGSAFELYRKPQIGAAGHHHNMSEMEPYDEHYGNFYPVSQCSERAVPPYVVNSNEQHNNNNLKYYNQHRDHYHQQLQQQQHLHHQQQQQFYMNGGAACSSPPPPLPPPSKAKKKSVLKSPLAAIKNAIIKTTRPLRRMNSVVEPERKLKPCIRRQHSMMERGMGRLCYPDEYPTYPGYELHDEQQQEQRYHRRSGSVPPQKMVRGQYYQQQQHQQHFASRDMLNNTYQNLETEDIYGNIGPITRNNHVRQQNDYDNLYANRALIDLERRQAEAAASRSGRRIIRRHSTTTADRMAASNSGAGAAGGIGRRHIMITSSPGANSASYDQEEIYQSRHGAYLLDAQRRAPNSEVMARRRFYPGGVASDQPESIHHAARREMHRNHLYQSKKEMQERIALGKKEMEREFSPPSSSSHSERDDKSDRDSLIYQSRREVKESAMKTRSQLREQIYQTRRDAMESMAEPIYVSKRDVVTRPEPIYESKEECILQSRENETDERKEGKTEVNTLADIPSEEDTLSNSKNSDFQKSTETIIENTMLIANKPEPIVGRAPLVRSEVDDDDDDDDEDEDDLGDADDNDEEEENQNENNESTQEEPSHDSSNCNDSTTSSALLDMRPPLEAAIESPTKPSISPRRRRNCSPLQLTTNTVKRTDSMTSPPQMVIPATADSRTSLETQYTSSQGSLQPVGPPNATSTPYTSNMSLPMAGPVHPTITAATTMTTTPTTANGGSTTITQSLFPMMPSEPTTTKGVFDSKGGTLADSIWNVSLQIPSGAIPPGIKQEIYFTVSDPRMGQTVGGPPLDMENGETMLSPLVMCGPQGLEFLVPVTLNIPHCAGRTASLGLALKATDSEKNLHTEWDNIDLPSNAAAHTVSVKVDHF